MAVYIFYCFIKNYYKLSHLKIFFYYLTFSVGQESALNWVLCSMSYEATIQVYTGAAVSSDAQLKVCFQYIYKDWIILFLISYGF